MRKIKETDGVMYNGQQYVIRTDRNYLYLHYNSYIRFPLDTIVQVHMDGMIVAEDENNIIRSFHFIKMETFFFQVNE